MSKYFVIISVLFIVGCKMNSVTSNSLSWYNEKVDDFTGQRVLSSAVTCSLKYGPGEVCTSFRFIDTDATMRIGYKSENWLFVNKILIKNKSTEEIYVVEGDYNDWVRETEYGGIITENIRINVDEKLFSFIESSIGNEIVWRFEGTDYYTDITETIGSDTTLNQWANFVEKYNSLNL